jgi:hypothetical protein
MVAALLVRGKGKGEKYLRWTLDPDPWTLNPGPMFT